MNNKNKCIITIHVSQMFHGNQILMARLTETNMLRSLSILSIIQESMMPSMINYFINLI